MNNHLVGRIEEEVSHSSLGGSNDSSTSGSRHSGTSSYASGATNDKEDLNIASDEDKAVFRIRIAVAFFLTVCTFGAAILVYTITRKQEYAELESASTDFATKVFSSLATAWDQTMAATDAFAVSCVSLAEATNMTWPFVTIPNSAVRLAKVLSVARSTFIAVAPLVKNEHREAWDEYSVANGPSWVEGNIDIQTSYEKYTGTTPTNYTVSGMWNAEGPVLGNNSYYFPLWQKYPTPDISSPPFNMDLASSSNTFVPSAVNFYDIVKTGNAHLSDIGTPDAGLSSFFAGAVGDAFNTSEPFMEIYYPIFSEAVDSVSVVEGGGVSSEMLGVVFLVFHWPNVMHDLLPDGVNGVILVVQTSCGSSFSYEINGPHSTFLGYGDHHDPKYDKYALQTYGLELPKWLVGGSVYSGYHVTLQSCLYDLRVYPSDVFEEEYITSNPWIYMTVTVAIFIFTSCVFFAYDWIVERRQKSVMKAESSFSITASAIPALKSSAIVSSLFPKNVRNRLYDIGPNVPTQKGFSEKKKLKTFMSSDSGTPPTETPIISQFAGSPIADLFPEATVLFADIANFTAWSSTRQPSQVFILLETVFGSFDKLAARRRVFKVETIGDCYVAVTGLPDPRADHAVAMVKFANDCNEQMQKLTAALAVTLGPDTEDLTMRFGLNSGPVTAGVLRGQKSRFQLFGDTVNTAARMESSGEKSRIHISQSTANELTKHNYQHWLLAREDSVKVKGKGIMNTFWVTPRGTAKSSLGESVAVDYHDESVREPTPGPDKETLLKIARLVDWNVQILGKQLQTIFAWRKCRPLKEIEGSGDFIKNVKFGSRPLDEVKEIIELPEFDQQVAHIETHAIDLDPKVRSLLLEYVTAIAESYRANNPFHNFEHASHVCMSVSKLVSRIVAVDETYEQHAAGLTVEQFLHEQTFGITSDPLSLFACSFAALIHDVDHPGVPNTRLVEEQTEDAVKYGNRSVAEQRSVDVAWDLLMLEKFKELREAICPTPGELRRFRELVVNGVMATDVMDKDLKSLRNDRWDKAFSVASNESSERKMTMNRKATIVMEHLIQASDVAHTMQHWHVFRKWNQRLFEEMMTAFHEGRAAKNPVEFWYQGELGFFDFYIIPLAKKLSDCGVFGVSSDEYLNYAMKNREEWAMKGEAIVKDMETRFAISK
eukprot:Nitzschia sp. Nitz4//scaffold112_size70979//18031//21628//NITZ4_005896-RA/size70979-processed-gene-0.34-mRNA-1//1//CDS//3329533247//6761//frame0